MRPPPSSLHERNAGVLLHPTSLPGRHGCGGLGADARTFVDFLEAAGQRWWQVLPLGPSGAGNSPYSASSVFAGNPLLIDPDELVADGLLDDADVTPDGAFQTTSVEFGLVARERTRLLRLAFERAGGATDDEGARFEREAAPWLHDACLFEALKGEHGGGPWTDWPADVRSRRPGALDAACDRLRDEIGFARFVQTTFDRHWSRLKRYANERGVGIIGDLPFYVSHDSADVWAHAALFELDAQGHRTCGSGVPPDYFSEDGQLWGHPLYAWPAHRAEQFRWWVERVRWAMRQCDALRLDHFLGVYRCWSVPAGARTARDGTWVLSPGRALLDVLHRRVDGLKLIAEDLGLATPEAEALRRGFEIPGMRVLQFGFDENGDRAHQPHRFPNACVAYTGTHDNDTVVGWLTNPENTRPGGDDLSVRDRVLRYAQSDGAHAHQDMIRLLYGSPAEIAIVPMQDVLGLGNEARMNQPGIAEGNWGWRCQSSGLDQSAARALRRMGETYERAAP